MQDLRRFAAVGAAAAGLLGLTGLAQAERVDLVVFENDSGADVSGLDLWVDVTQVGDQAQFVFHNDSTIDSFISAIYFEDAADASGLGAASITNEPSGVNFEAGATPPNPPGSISDFGGPWGGNLASFDANPPAPTNGINVGETLTIAIDLDGVAFADLLGGLEAGEWRIAQHVQGIGPDDDSVWTTTVIPLPAAFWPGAIGLAGVAFGGYLRKRRTA